MELNFVAKRIFRFVFALVLGLVFVVAVILFLVFTMKGVYATAKDFLDAPTHTQILVSLFFATALGVAYLFRGVFFTGLADDSDCEVRDKIDGVS